MSRQTFRTVSRMTIDGRVLEPGSKIQGDVSDPDIRGWLRAGNIVREKPKRKKSANKKGDA